MRRLVLYVALIALLPGVWKIGSVNAAGENTQQAAAPQTAATTGAAASGYAGADSCAICHQAEVAGFPNNPHTKLALEHGGKGVTCESCHGPGQAHVESGGVASKIFQFTKATPKEADEKCVGCHAGAHPNFERSTHGEAGVSCISCHSIHKFAAETVLLKLKQPALCYQCHTEVKAAFAQPFHHKVPEGLVKCSDCHDPHGTFQSNQLRSTADQNAICTKCHIENAGPFVYEHPVVKTEGCVSCHSPHGSPNPRLLNVSNVNTLCLQCHSASMNFTAPGAPSFHNQATQYQACTICHTQIHGSNASDIFFK